MDTPVNGRKLAITLYENSKNPNGRSASASLDQLKAVLSKRYVREEKDGKSFSPHRLVEGGTRKNINVEFLSMAVADIDDGVTLDELRPFISQYAWVATSSHSHTNEHHKFRLVFPLARDVYAAEWADFRTRFHDLLQGHIDPSTKDAARFYYLPSCPESTVDQAFYEFNDAPWLDPDEFGVAPVDNSSKSDSAESKFENEFGAAKEFPPASLALAADRCLQLQDFRDTGGATEPLWYGYLGVAKHCVDGEELSHEWSSKYYGYTREETQRKLDQWAYGPTKCEKFKELNGDRCKECAFRDKVTSPIQLGVVEETVAPEVEAEDGITPQTLGFWPHGFHVAGEKLQYVIPATDDTPAKHIDVAAPWFYFKERIELGDGTYAYKLSAEIRKNKWRDFEVDARYAAETRSLKSILASYEVMVMNDKLLEINFREWGSHLRRTRDEIKTFKQQGWNEKRTGFLIGDELIHEHGRTKVRIDRTVIADPQLLKSSSVKGTKEEWTEGVMELYNNRQGLPYQYAILTQFAAPLAPLLGFANWNGIPLALTSDDSGYGKTTVIQIGINALCNSNETMLSSVTPKAIINRAGQMNHVPVLFDELTQHLKDPEDLAGVSYDLSNGRGRVGLDSNGKEREAGLTFELMASITANKNFFEKLAQAKVNPMATQMRIFEIPMESYEKLESMRESSKNHARHHELAMHLVTNVHGVWADEYIRFIVKNKTEVTNKLRSTATAIITHLGGNAARERFYAYHVACVLVAGWIARKIGAVGFDINELKNWALRHIHKMRGVAARYSNNTEDMFAKLLSDLHGAILITKSYDKLDSRSGAVEVPLLPLRNAPVARLVLGTDKERSKFFVSVKAVEDWCVKNDVTGTQFRRMLSAAGLLRGDGTGKGFDKKISLSKGVPSHPTGQCRCYELEYAAVQGYIEEHVGGKVVAINQPVADSVAEETTEAA